MGRVRLLGKVTMCIKTGRNDYIHSMWLAEVTFNPDSQRFKFETYSIWVNFFMNVPSITYNLIQDYC